MSASISLRKLSLIPILFILVCSQTVDGVYAQQDDPFGFGSEEPEKVERPPLLDEVHDLRLKRGKYVQVDLRKYAEGDALDLYSAVQELYRQKLMEGAVDPEDRDLVDFAIRFMAEAPTVQNIRTLAMRIDYRHPPRTSVSSEGAALGGSGSLVWPTMTQSRYSCVKSICKIGEPAVSTLREYLVTANTLSDQQLELLVYCVLEIRDNGLDGKGSELLDREERNRQIQLLSYAAKRSTLPESEIVRRLKLAKYFMSEIDLRFYNSRVHKTFGAPPARSVIFQKKKGEE